jgi:putative membrane protein
VSDNNQSKRSSIGRIARKTDKAATHAQEAAEHTSDAARTASRAAHETAAAADVTKSSAERTTELAADRTILAFERTYAAWVRSGLVALASGIGARKLLEGVLPDWMVVLTGLILLLFSCFCFVAGVWRHLLRIEHPAPDAPKIPSFVLVLFNGFLALVALISCFGIVLGVSK